MPAGQTLPLLWLLSDARNDAWLERALDELPAGSGFVYRHYHLQPNARRLRYAELHRIAARRRHVVIVAGEAAGLDADGFYGAMRTRDVDGLYLATAHDEAELARAERAGADAVFLSPVFNTRSHPDAAALGIHGFQALARQTRLPVIALGGMTAARARELDWPRWGAIDGLVPSQES